jgi:hypothetical protein
MPTLLFVQKIGKLLSNEHWHDVLWHIIKAQEENEILQIVNCGDQIGIKMLNKLIEEEQEFIDKHHVPSDFILKNQALGALIGIRFGYPTQTTAA